MFDFVARGKSGHLQAKRIKAQSVRFGATEMRYRPCHRGASRRFTTVQALPALPWSIDSQLHLDLGLAFAPQHVDGDVVAVAAQEQIQIRIADAQSMNAN